MSDPVAPEPTPRVVLDGPDLLVDDERFVVLGAELHNSSASSRQAIAASFDRVRSLGANTVLAPVAWDLWEPDEGSFDTDLVDALLTAARERELRLVLLWFGSWKNGMSTYAPPWVKRDTGRFPRAHTAANGRIEHLSPFAAESRRADARAFTALMSHLRDTDAQRTVLMVQVENEVGLLGDSRDRGPLAEKAFHAAVPSEVVDAVARSPHLPVHDDWIAAGSRREGTWPAVFGAGPNADEAFMAHAYASFIGHIAAAGRGVHDVPLYVNAWLDVPIELDLPPGTDLAALANPGHQAPDTAEVAFAGGQVPGNYPSGGPLPRVAPIWQCAAPAIDFLSPDIYFGDFDTICRDYAGASGRLFIPEMRRSAVGVAQMFAAVGAYGALGVAPFGVDSLTDGDPEATQLADAYRLLAAASDRMRAGATRTAGFVLTPERPTATVEVGPYTLTATARDPLTSTASADAAYGILLQEAEDQFLVVGRGFALAFPGTAADAKVGILSADELDFDGAWTVARRLNGDETAGSSIRLQRLGATQPAFFPIPMGLRSTGIVRVRLYTY